MHVNEAPSPKPVVDTPPKSDLEKEVQKRKLRLLSLATREWSKIESRMNNTEPKYLIGSVKAFVSRHEKLVIRIGEYEEAIHASGQSRRSMTASQPNPPRNTLHCANADCSHGCSSSQDQSNAPRSVACRRGPDEAGRDNSLNRSERRARRVFGGHMRTRAAASSMASGNPSRFGREG